jgi:aminomethyltransferase
MTETSGLRHSPLHRRHLDLGAKLAEFGGWEMPIEYAGTGVVKEHTAVREAAGVFDVTHLGKVSVRGPGAAAFVDATLTNDLGRIGPGKAQYTLCCDDETGGIVDDLIAYLRAEDDVFLVPNAANTAEVARRLADAAPPGVSVENLHEAFGVLAVQGPRCAEPLRRVGVPVGHEYMSFVDAEVGGRPLAVCRTGYTGARGFELLPRWADTVWLWDALLDAARDDRGLTPCGLGARDTLRTEMGYALHGQDISLDVTPLQARLGWAVGWDKPAFWGREVLLAEKAAGARRLLRGLEGLERAIPRPHMTVYGASGAPVGEVTSGTFSPTRRIGIALALLDRSVSEGDEVTVDVRGRAARFRVVRPPFVKASVT